MKTEFSWGWLIFWCLSNPMFGIIYILIKSMKGGQHGK